ncbi:TPA: hypothetical protein ACH3X2_005449 [Trebouxia sp. C0005]
MLAHMPHAGLQQTTLRQQAATVRWPAATCSDQRYGQRRRAVCQAGSNNKTDLTALVVGSGFSGLYAAAGLSSRFAQVTLLDKDDFADAVNVETAIDPEVWREQYEAATNRRRGVSQYKQPHVMFKKGLELMEELIPGYKQELSQAGALEIDQIRDIYFSNWGKDWRPGTASGLPSLAASRHLYECVLRKFVLGINNLCVEIGALVDGLVYDAQQERVTGLHLKSGQILSADLVIDASGKASNISKWLESIGHRPPSTWSVNAGLKYAYRMYEMTEDADRDWLLAMCMDYPQGSRVGMMIPIETNKWQEVRCKGKYAPAREHPDDNIDEQLFSDITEGPV